MFHIRNRSIRQFGLSHLTILTVLMLLAWPYMNIHINKPNIQGAISAHERAEIERALANMGTFTFISFSPQRVVEQLRDIPWLSDVSVQRDFPLGWRLSITRATPVALWQDQFYLDGRGRLSAFDQASIKTQGLPRLSGTEGYATEVWARYREFANILAIHTNLRIQALRLDGLRQWQLTTVDGISIYVPYLNPSYNLRRFAGAYNYLRDTNHGLIKRVNLHYENGMAIEWCSAQNTDCMAKEV